MAGGSIEYIGKYTHKPILYRKFAYKMLHITQSDEFFDDILKNSLKNHTQTHTRRRRFTINRSNAWLAHRTRRGRAFKFHAAPMTPRMQQEGNRADILASTGGACPLVRCSHALLSNPPTTYHSYWTLLALPFSKIPCLAAPGPPPE